MQIGRIQLDDEDSCITSLSSNDDNLVFTGHDNNLVRFCDIRVTNVQVGLAIFISIGFHGPL